MIDNEVISRIAKKIRATRLQRNMTIQQLATRMHVSKGLVSKIENSKTIPSLPVFVTLLKSLDISLKTFFDDMLLISGPEFVLIKKDQLNAVEMDGTNGVSYQNILAQHIPQCTVEASLLTINPGSIGKTITTDGYEFKYILSGTCEYQINDRLILLEEGDTIYVDATSPHTLANHTNKRVVILAISFITEQQ